MSRPELLAPAGSLDALRAAVCAGADAVYMAGPAFNARRNAKNFTEDELREATHQAADLLDKLERLGWERQATIAAIRAGDFEKVKTALGSQVIDRALAQAGVK